LLDTARILDIESSMEDPQGEMASV
jgi:hypothetical protein